MYSLQTLPVELVDLVLSFIDYRGMFNQVLKELPNATRKFYEKQDLLRPVQILSFDPLEYCVECFHFFGFPCPYCRLLENIFERSFGTGIVVWINHTEYVRYCVEQFTREIDEFGNNPD
jgi:hypothetical protein